MRENRTSGSEGGAAEPNRSSLPLSCSENRPQGPLTALPGGAQVGRDLAAVKKGAGTGSFFLVRVCRFWPLPSLSR